MLKSLTNRIILAAAAAVVVSAVLGFPFASDAGARLDRVLKDKVLRVGTPGDYRPFAMREGDKYVGHDVDVIEAIAALIGAGVNQPIKVQYVQTSWPTLMDDYLADKFDVAVGGISRNVARMVKADFLPPYAPSGKVALIRVDMKDKLNTPESLNQPNVRVIKNPGGTNEKYVDANLTKAKVTTHDKNAEIPAMIAEGKGDVMITDTLEAILYSKQDNRLYVAFIENPLTPIDYKGFMLKIDDSDFLRVMNFAWDQLRLRGELDRLADVWLR
ncbi:MAG: transporter substrate-binding domain-containing protein [Synergistaceae bacterium]|nr:transporter substrate-binding domain-containing protein [Synergistaceae bacterium]